MKKSLVGCLIVMSVLSGCQSTPEKPQPSSSPVNQELKIKRNALQPETLYKQKEVRAAMVTLGFLHAKGLGVPKDYAEAFAWNYKAAHLGEPVAMYNVGFLYDKGRGVPQNRTKALEWLKKAAALGELNAQRYLDQIQDQQVVSN